MTKGKPDENQVNTNFIDYWTANELIFKCLITFENIRNRKLFNYDVY